MKPITDLWMGESGAVYVGYDGGKTGEEFIGFEDFAKWLCERERTIATNGNDGDSQP